MDGNRRLRARDSRDGAHGTTTILIEACDENEFAYEYRHGNIAYGAFTYALCEAIRDVARRNKERRRLKQKPLALTFDGLHEELKKRIHSVIPEPQNPQIVGPRAWRNKPIPGI